MIFGARSRYGCALARAIVYACVCVCVQQRIRHFFAGPPEPMQTLQAPSALRKNTHPCVKLAPARTVMVHKPTRACAHWGTATYNTHSKFVCYSNTTYTTMPSPPCAQAVHGLACFDMTYRHGGRNGKLPCHRPQHAPMAPHRRTAPPQVRRRFAAGPAAACRGNVRKASAKIQAKA